MKNITISAFEAQHEDLLKNMIFSLYEDEGEKMSVEKIQNTIKHAAENPNTLQIKIIKKDENVAGYAILSAFWSNEYGGLVLIIDELFILPNFRNQGISTHFFEQLNQKNEYVQFNLEVFTNNISAFNLYERLGFQPIERIFMKKKRS